MAITKKVTNMSQMLMLLFFFLTQMELDMALSDLEAADFAELVREGASFTKGSMLNSCFVYQSLF